MESGEEFQLQRMTAPSEQFLQCRATAKVICCLPSISILFFSFSNCCWCVTNPRLCDCGGCWRWVATCPVKNGSDGKDPILESDTDGTKQTAAGAARAAAHEKGMKEVNFAVIGEVIIEASVEVAL